MFWIIIIQVIVFLLFQCEPSGTCSNSDNACTGYALFLAASVKEAGLSIIMVSEVVFSFGLCS